MRTALRNRKNLVKAGQTRNFRSGSAIRLFRKVGKTYMKLRWIRFTIAASLTAASSFGQYPAGSPGSGGYHSSTGIAIGAGAAAAAGIGYLVLRNHNHATVSGCLQSADNVNMLLDSKQNTYTLINSKSVPLKAGERVELRGKKVQRNSGTLAFEVHGLVKDYGQCQQ